MKKLIHIILITVFFYGCGDGVEFNSPAFQAERNSQIWLAEDFSASIAGDGTLTIKGENGLEVVRLILPNATAGTFITGCENVAIAEYTDAFETNFSSANSPDETVSIFPELGEIIIEEINPNNFVSGKFRFFAFDSEGLNSVNFINGVFLRVPIESASED